MQGWVAGLVEWTEAVAGGTSAQFLIQDLEQPETVQDFMDRNLEIINLITPADTSPRLRAYLESQLGNATWSPWAIFRD